MALRVMAVNCCLVVAFLCCCNLSSATRIIHPMLSKSTVAEGESLKLVCVSNETMIWKAHGVQVDQTSGRIRVTEENSTGGAERLQSTLVIGNLTSVDSATYECKDKSDTYGDDMAQIDIKVVKATKLKVDIVVNNVTGKVEAVGKKVKLSVGDDLNLHCTGEGRSKPSWKVDGVLLKDGSDIVINDVYDRAENSRKSMLSGHNVTKAVAGRYQCVDTASYQSNSEEFTVVVSSVAKSAASAIVLALSAVLVTVSSSLFH